MKISIALSVLILVAATCLRWHDSQRLALVRENYTKLAAEAAAFGISLDPSRPTDSVRIIRRERESEDKEVEARTAAAELITNKKGMWFAQTPDQAEKQRIIEIYDRITSFDSAQMKILIAEVRAAKDLKDQTRGDIISLSLMSMSNHHPQATLALFTDSPELLKECDRLGGLAVSSALTQWAKEDPMGTLEWVRKNAEKFPDLVTLSAKDGVISGIAAKNPKLAFKLIGELGVQDISHAMSVVVATANTSAGRTAALAAFRENLATLPDEKTRIEATAKSMESLAHGLVREGFASATQWIAGANCTPTELESLARSVSSSIKPDETGQWLEWIGEKLPAEKSRAHIRETVSKWTRDDYQAAGKWLAATPAGPTKNTAIRSYAETVSKYDSATATQWAMTLPPGEEREETLKNIQENSPTK
jgi:hypothetical protein